MVSRLKGIETIAHFLTLGVSIALDMVSRLKGIETHESPQSTHRLNSLYMVSRLKGIETRVPSCQMPSVGLCIWFPVWRELKLFWKFIFFHFLSNDFVYGFPFEGNWNHLGGFLHRSCWYFVYGFPFEGNWNLILRPSLEILSPLCICFPVWRELKLLLRHRERGRGNPLDMVSRLKGIETYDPQFRGKPLIDFVYAFPFEGNWNCKLINMAPYPNPTFVYGFPFEGNWNWITLLGTSEKNETTLDMLSRLKGIETIWWIDESSTSPSPFGYGFPFEGNWNEKNPSVCPHSYLLYFGYGFPFEGNWNSLGANHFMHHTAILCICFPVWRELKLKPNKLYLKWLPSLYMVSRLKGIETLAGLFVFGTSCAFGYGFPFEGNWNAQRFPPGSAFRSPLDMLSRLKGIETKRLSPLHWNSQYDPLDMVSRLKGIETLERYSISTVFLPLWIWFPVWRELKLSNIHNRERVIRFGYGFPFEGNWNL